MKINTTNTLIIEEKDLDNWNYVACELCSKRFDLILIPSGLTSKQIGLLLCHKKENGSIYECRDLYE